MVKGGDDRDKTQFSVQILGLVVLSVFLSVSFFQQKHSKHKKKSVNSRQTSQTQGHSRSDPDTFATEVELPLVLAG